MDGPHPPHEATVFKLLMPYLGCWDAMQLRWVCSSSRRASVALLGTWEEISHIWASVRGADAWGVTLLQEASVGCDFVDGGAHGPLSPIDKFRSCVPCVVGGQLRLYVNEESYAYDPPTRQGVCIGDASFQLVLGGRFYVLAAREDGLLLLRGWWSPEHEYLFLFRNGKEEARVSCQGLGLLDSNCQGLRHVWKKHSLVFLAGSRVVELSLPELRASTLFTLDSSFQLLTGPILLHGSEVVVVMQPWQHKGEAGGRHIVVLSCSVRMEIPCQDDLVASCGFMSSLWLLFRCGNMYKGPSSFCVVEVNIKRRDSRLIPLEWRGPVGFIKPTFACDAICLFIVLEGDLLILQTKGNAKSVKVVAGTQKSPPPFHGMLQGPDSLIESRVLGALQTHQHNGLLLYSERIRYLMPERIHNCRVELITISRSSLV